MAQISQNGKNILILQAFSAKVAQSFWTGLEIMVNIFHFPFFTYRANIFVNMLVQFVLNLNIKNMKKVKLSCRKTLEKHFWKSSF